MKNRKMVRKIVSLLSCAAMLATSSVTSLALVYKQPVVIDVFATLSGASTVSEGLKGAVSPNDTFGRSQLVTGENGEKALRLGGSEGVSWIEWAFDEVIKTGVLHFGFDAKTEGESVLNVRLFSNQRFEENADYRKWWDETPDNNASWQGMLSINEASAGKVVFPDAFRDGGYSATGTAKDIESGWHRYDMYTTFGDGGWKTYYYYDGELAHTGGSTGGFKSIGLQGKGVEIDNISVKHYPKLKNAHTPENLAAGIEPKLDVDYRNGGAALNSGKLEVAFNEPMLVFDSYEPMPADFEIRDADGSVVSEAISDAAKVNGRALLTLGSLEEGYYTINVADTTDTREYYKGKISGKFPVASAPFVVGRSVDDSDRFYYMNEDFDDYTGGMPRGFVDWYLTSNSEKGFPMSAADGKTGKAFKFDADENAFYKFPQPIKNGKFTIEFDLYSDTGAGWQLGLPLAHEFETDEWKMVSGYDSDTKSLKLTNINRGFNYFIGNESGRRSGNGENNILTEVHYQTGKRNNATDQQGTNVYYPVPLGNLSVKPAEWNHFKAEVDLDSGTAEIILNNDVENAATITFNQNRFNAEYLVKSSAASTDFSGGTDSFANGKRKFVPGIGGIKLNAMYHYKETIGSTVMDCQLASDVRFDNVQVYTENSYNDTADFTSWAKDRAFNHPGWVVVDSELAPVCDQWLDYAGRQAVQYADVTSAVIQASETATTSRIGAVPRGDNDTALRFRGNVPDATKINSHAVNHFFNIPVKAGIPFDLEFDLYLPTENNAFAMGLLTSDTMLGVEGESSSASSLKPTVLMNLHQNSSSATDSQGAVAFVDGTHMPWQDSSFTTPVDTNNEQIFVAPGKWHKLVLSYIPEGAYAKLQLKVTDLEANTTKTSQIYTSNIETTKDITGIQLKQGKFDGSTYFDIDNIKVIEKQAPVKNKAIAAYEISYDGSAEPLDDTVLSSLAKIEIKLAKPISSTNGITVITNIPSEVEGQNLVTVDPTLSADGKSIYVTLDDALKAKAAEGFKMSISLTSELAGGYSYLDMFEPVTYSFNVTQPEAGVGELKITDYRLYQLHEEQNGVAANWNPVSKDLTNVPDGTRFKFIAKGYYTGLEPRTIDIFYVTRNENNTLKKITLTSVEVQNGEILYESDELTKETDGLFKSFAWDDITPLWENIDYSITWAAE